MERRYMWFHTSAGFVAAAVGIIVSMIAMFVVLANVPPNWQVQIPVLFVLFAIGILPAFLVERWYLSRLRRRSGAEKRDDRNH